MTTAGRAPSHLPPVVRSATGELSLPVADSPHGQRHRRQHRHQHVHGQARHPVSQEGRARSRPPRRARPVRGPVGAGPRPARAARGTGGQAGRPPGQAAGPHHLGRPGAPARAHRRDPRGRHDPPGAVRPRHRLARRGQGDPDQPRLPLRGLPARRGPDGSADPVGRRAGADRSAAAAVAAGGRAAVAHPLPQAGHPRLHRARGAGARGSHPGDRRGAARPHRGR